MKINIKNARLENARLRGRGSESATAREKSRSLALANSDLEPRVLISERLEFSCENLGFYF